MSGRSSVIMAMLFIGLASGFAALPSAGFLHDSAYVSRSWRTEQGIPQDSVWAIAQTPDGYLWIGTGGGLARFDGVKFKTFGLEEGLPALHVRVLLVDSRGMLWVGTANGPAVLENNRFRSFSGIDGVVGNNVYELAEDNEGAIWIGTSTGLSRWRNNQFDVPDASIRAARVLARDAGGSIWAAGHSKGLMRWTGKGFEKPRQPLDVRASEPNQVTGDAVGRLWMVAQARVFCMEGSQWRAYGAAEGLPNGPLLCVTAGRDGTIWVGSQDEGVYALHPGEKHFQRILPSNADLEAARAVFEDQEGNVWLGTRSSGLVQLRSKRVKTWRLQADNAELSPFSMAEDPEGALIVGTLGRGLFRVRDDSVEPILHSELEPYGLRTGLIFISREGDLWFAAGSRLLRWKDGKLDEIAGGGGGVSSLCQDRAGKIWIGSPSGMLRRFSDGRVTQINLGIPRAALAAMAADPEGGVWIGVYGYGLLHVRGDQHYWVGKGDGLRSDLVRAVHCDERGVVWIGTEGGGLSRLENGRVSNFGRAEGQPADTVLHILDDDAGHLWLGSYRGIVRVNLQQLRDVGAGAVSRLHPDLFGHPDGMSSQQCMSSFGGAVKLRDRRLCFATGSGIVVIDPRQHQWGHPLPPVRLEQLVADGKEVMLPSAYLSAPDQRAHSLPVIRIEPGKRRFEFAYTVPAFASSERVRFRHRLVGLDDEWVEAEQGRTVEYSYLPPGRYRFEVTAHSGNGIWTEPATGVDFFLRPSFWQTQWFKLGCGLGMIGLAGVVVRRVEKRRGQAQMQRLELERAMERERSRIARDIHDDLGSRLTRISMVTDQAIREAAPGHALTGHMQSIAETARDMLDRLDETVWVVNPRNDQLDRVAEYLLNYAQDFFQHTGIRCRLKVSEDIPGLPIRAEVRHNIFLSAKEAMNNAARHSGATEVRVELEYAANRLLVSIQDNGHGCDAQACLALGRGLENIKCRVMNLGGRFELVSRPGEGMTVLMEFELPATLTQTPVLS